MIRCPHAATAGVSLIREMRPAGQSRTAAHERAAARKYGQYQVEDEETLPDWLAVEAVVL
jgi:hypothetical protein